jgi:hypothetical protein
MRLEMVSLDIDKRWFTLGLRLEVVYTNILKMFGIRLVSICGKFQRKD